MSYTRDKIAKVTVPCRDFKNGERVVEDGVIEVHYSRVGGSRGRVRWWGRESGRLGWQSEGTLRRTILKCAHYPITARPDWMADAVAAVDRQLKVTK